VPSTYFIGVNGAPIEVTAGHKEKSEFLQVFQSVLKVFLQVFQSVLKVFLQVIQSVLKVFLQVFQSVLKVFLQVIQSVLKVFQTANNTACINFFIDWIKTFEKTMYEKRGLLT
jgi:phage-related protein